MKTIDDLKNKTLYFFWHLTIFLLLFAGAHAFALAQPALEGRTLLYKKDDKIAWEVHFPAGTGSIIGPVLLDHRVYLGIGPVVYAWDKKGKLLGRADLPTTVSHLDTSGGVVHVSVSSEGYNERFALGEPQDDYLLPVEQRVVFVPDIEVTKWLQNYAKSVPAHELKEAVKADPSNPFLILRQAKQAQLETSEHTSEHNSYDMIRAVRRSLGMALPFYAWTQLAVELDSMGFPTAADLALLRARKDAALRGLSPDVPISRQALIAYGNPLGYIGTLLEQGRTLRAEVWMRHLRELHPYFEGRNALYLRYAQQLEAQGRTGEAEEWRQFNRSLRTGTLYNLGSQDTVLLKQTAKWTAYALSLVLLAALLTLKARIWKMQMADTQALGGYFKSWWSLVQRLRMTTLGYARPSERVMLCTFSVLLLLVLSGWKWSVRTETGLNQPALNIGTYGGGWQASQMAELELRAAPETEFVFGLMAQLDSDDNIARRHYNKAKDACTLNNLGAMAQKREDLPQARADYRTALSLRPDQTVTLYNLGLQPPAAVADFQRQYLPAQPLLCYPDRRMLSQVVSENLNVTLGRVFITPMVFLRTDPYTEQPPSRLDVALVLCWGYTVFLLLMLTIPRTVSVHAHKHRGWGIFFSFMLPGTGLLSHPWGGMLLLVWAMSSIALLPMTGLSQFSWLGETQISLMQPVALIGWLGSYVINTVVLSWAWMRKHRKAKEL